MNDWAEAAAEAMPATAPKIPRRPLVIGHRGAPGYRPEHTASAYREAIAQGVDAVEPDIVVSRDGVLVIRHETEISGTTDVASRPEFAHRKTVKRVDGKRVSGWFAEDFDWAELRTLRARERLPALRGASAAFDGTESILSFRELLALVDESERDISVVIELKHVASLQKSGFGVVELLRDELQRSGWRERPERLIIESFDLGPLLRLRDVLPGATLVFLTETDGAPFDQVLEHGPKAKPFSWYRTDEGLEYLAGVVAGLSVAKRDLLVDPSLVGRAHARGLRVFTWTLRPENRFLSSEYAKGRDAGTWGDWRSEWGRIIATGVDGVFVDHPALMIELLGELQSGAPQAAQ